MLQDVTLRVYETAREVADAAADLLLEVADNLSGMDLEGFVALSGGSTPKVMYENLSKRGPVAGKSLSRLHFFFGDERNVGNYDERSNVRLALEGFLHPLKIPLAHIHAPDGAAADLEGEAARLSRMLELHLPRTRTRIPQFDLVFLGVGNDGHTASLFPGTKALDATFPGYVANEVPQLDTRRLTLTYPVLNKAAHVAVLATGESKAPILAQIFGSTERETKYPIEQIDGPKVLWLLDREAASGIPPEKLRELSR